MNMRIKALNKLINVKDDVTDIPEGVQQQGMQTPRVYKPNPAKYSMQGIEEAAAALQQGDPDVSNSQFNQMADAQAQQAKMDALVKEYEDMKAMGFNVRDPRTIMMDINSQNPGMNAQQMRSNYNKKMGLK